MNVRIQFDLPEDKVIELEELMKESDISTRKDLFNNALTLFKWAVKERKANRIIASVDEINQKFKELVMPSLSGISPNEDALVNKEMKLKRNKELAGAAG